MCVNHTATERHAEHSGVNLVTASPYPAVLVRSTRLRNPIGSLLPFVGDIPGCTERPSYHITLCNVFYIYQMPSSTAHLHFKCVAGHCHHLLPIALYEMLLYGWINLLNELSLVFFETFCQPFLQ